MAGTRSMLVSRRSRMGRFSFRAVLGIWWFTRTAVNSYTLPSAKSAGTKTGRWKTSCPRPPSSRRGKTRGESQAGVGEGCACPDLLGRPVRDRVGPLDEPVGSVTLGCLLRAPGPVIVMPPAEDEPGAVPWLHSPLIDLCQRSISPFRLRIVGRSSDVRHARDPNELLEV